MLFLNYLQCGRCGRGGRGVLGRGGLVVYGGGGGGQRREPGGRDALLVLLLLPGDAVGRHPTVLSPLDEKKITFSNRHSFRFHILCMYST